MRKLLMTTPVLLFTGAAGAFISGVGYGLLIHKVIFKR